MTGLGTAATTMPMVGCGESRAGLPQGMVGPGVLASVLLIWVSLGRGECSFCSCCFFWILRCSCCFASTEGEGRVFTWGWKELASAVGTNAEAGVGVFIPVKEKNSKNYEKRKALQTKGSQWWQFQDLQKGFKLKTLIHLADKYIYWKKCPHLFQCVSSL